MRGRYKFFIVLASKFSAGGNPPFMFICTNRVFEIETNSSDIKWHSFRIIPTVCRLLCMYVVRWHSHACSLSFTTLLSNHYHLPLFLYHSVCALLHGVQQHPNTSFPIFLYPDKHFGVSELETFCQSSLASVKCGFDQTSRR